MRVDLLLTDRPITPSGTGRAAPPVCCPELRPTGRRCSRHLLDLKSGRGSGAPEITKDQPLGGGPLRKLDYIIGVQGYSSQPPAPSIAPIVFLVSAMFGVSVQSGEHTATSTHVTGLNVWGFVVLAVVVVGLILGFFAWRRRRHRRIATGGTR